MIYRHFFGGSRWWPESMGKGAHLALFLLLFVAAPAFAGKTTAKSSIVWTDGVPYLEVTVALGQAPATLGKLEAPVVLFDNSGKRLWQGVVTLPTNSTPSWTGKTKLEQIVDREAQHRVQVEMNKPEIEMIYSETLWFSGPSKPLQFRSLRKNNAFPDESIRAVVRLGGIRERFVKGTTLDWILRDAAENVVTKKQETIPVSEEVTDYEVEIIPDRRSSGPYEFECHLSNDTGLNLNWVDRFAFATALVPVSSMETDDMTDWYRSTFADPKSLNYDNTPFSLQHTSDPAVFDEKVAHSGTRSLRLDYKEGIPGQVYGNLAMPGLPIRARVWVKGNGTHDRLIVFWRDKYEFSAGPRDYFEPVLNVSSTTLGTLDFDGWRCFTAPVLGAGLQALTRNNNKGAIMVPIHVFAFAVEPEILPKDQKYGNAERTVWIDDLAVETQLPIDQRVSLELRSDTPDRRLHDKAQLVVSVGNGSKADIRNGRLSIAIKDRYGKAMGEITETTDVKSGEFGLKTIPLGAIAQKLPEGPVDMEVTFIDPANALRIAKRVVFKRSNCSALFWDFEKPDAYNGCFASIGKAFVPVKGGAEGSVMALSLHAETGQVSSVLLHPALPGITDRIEAHVKGGDAPAYLQPLFLDAGGTGVRMPFNKFRPPVIRVDWQGWRKIEFCAPAVSQNYNDETSTFLLTPKYPLNLAFTAVAAGDKPADILIDNVRVWTHLCPDERFAMEVDYPNDMHIHTPGTPLKIMLVNFADSERKSRLCFKLRNLYDWPAQDKEMDVVVPAGGRSLPVLEASLAPGIYVLNVEEPAGQKCEGIVTVIDPKRDFGDQPEKSLTSLLELEKALGMTVKKVYIDWDNVEKVPGVFTYTCVHNDVKRTKASGYKMVPVVGFAADWAGPEKQESIAKGEYSRYMGNHLQTPVRMADWNCFTREVAREYKGLFETWTFWENPDVADSPVYIPPPKYPEMLGVFKHWLSLYDPKARVIAGGFNFDQILGYLDKIQDPHKLPFDMIGVQMNIGELAPEQADVERLLSELDELLKLRETGRQVVVPELDWSVGRFVSAADQAAYHARARLILNALGAAPYQCHLVNTVEKEEGFGLFYRVPYGNTLNVASSRPTYIPKPAYFALMQMGRFLREWKFHKSVRPPDADLQANRAYIYTNSQKRLAVALWRVNKGEQNYLIPSGWKDVQGVDAFGLAIQALKSMLCRALPLFVYLPAGYDAAQLVNDLRMLTPTNGAPSVLLDLHVSEADCAGRGGYRRTGNTTESRKVGRIPAAGSWDEVFVNGIESEQFEFTSRATGNMLLSRYWFSDGKTGQNLTVRLNDGVEQGWDLSYPVDGERKKFYRAGIQRSSYVLRGCREGVNTVKILYETAGNCAGYRVEPMEGDIVDLTQWGLLAAVQSKGELQKNQSASGTPLAIGKTRYETGLGSHAVAILEYPLNGLFSGFEAKVGVDGVTDGKGSVIFKILVDGVEKTKTGLMTGFDKPEKLTVNGLDKAKRLTLIVEDGGDGQQDDLADWVEGKLFLTGNRGVVLKGGEAKPAAK